LHRYLTEQQPYKDMEAEARRIHPTARTFDDWARNVAAPIWRAI